MPKNTFFNLCEEKQMRIIHAGYTIFLNNSYESVTIRDIVKEADIPIGSFYRYFEDKDDLYIYMIDQIENKIYKALIENNLNTNSMLIGNTSAEFLKEVLTEKEYNFDQTFNYVPETLLGKYYYHQFNKNMKEEYRKNILNLSNDNLLKEDIDFDFILHMYITSMYNIIMYFREKGITSFEEREKIKKYFYEQIFLNGITK